MDKGTEAAWMLLAIQQLSDAGYGYGPGTNRQGSFKSPLSKKTKAGRKRNKLAKASRKRNR